MVEEANPYQSPESALSEEQAAPYDVIPAGKWLRFFTYIIDYFSFLVLAMIIGGFIGLIWGDRGLVMIEKVPDLVFGVVLMLCYYVPFEAYSGRSIGKLIVGTKVVNEEGLNANIGQIIGRTFCRFIPFEVFSFLGPSGRGWHDSIPKTYVVNVRKQRKERKQ